MANFMLAYAVTLKHEGGYANHKADRGGETYKGIARNRHPDWLGWKTIDAHFAAGGNHHDLVSLPGLASLVMDFYKLDFWDKLRADEITSQAVANELFDTAVNMGHGRAIKFLQRSINLLSRIGAAGIAEDGAIGPFTIKALNAVIDRYGDKPVVKAQDGLQFGHYVKIVNKNPSQQVFFRGWLRRVS